MTSPKPQALRVGYVHFDSRCSLCWTFFHYHLVIQVKQLGVGFMDRPVITLQEQIDAISQLIDEKIDVLLVRPIAANNQGLLAVLHWAKEQGIRLISIDGSPGKDSAHAIIRSDNFGGQAKLAEYVFEQLGGQGKVAYLQGDLRAQPGLLRTQGLHQILERYPGINLVYEAALDWSSVSSRQAMGSELAREAIQKHPDLKAIISASDECAFGVIDVVEELGLQAQIMVAGFDGLPEALMAVEDGRMQVTARQSLDTMAVRALDLACQPLTHTWQDTEISLDVELITKTSVAQAAVRVMRIFPEITRDLIERSYQQQSAATFLETLLDNMPTMLFVKEAEHLRYVRVNHARESWFGAAHGSQIGKTPHEIYASDVADRIVQTDREVLNSGLPSSRAEEIMTVPGLGLRYLQTKKIPLFDISGKPSFLLGISEDITEQKEAATILNQRAKELEQAYQALQENQDQLLAAAKMASLGSLVAGIAHELNTPIGNALMAATTFMEHTRDINHSYAQGIKRSMLEKYLSEAAQAADILVRNLRRGADLVNSFKQVAVDQTSSQRRSFSLATVLSEIMITLRPSIKKSAVEVRLDIAPDLSLDSYPGPLGQVVTNLVNNALLHGMAERDSGLITITAQALDAQCLTLTVQDNGVGIEEKNIARIFDPFFTTRLGTGGSGLGLNISHNIVTGLLGGQIEATSELGVGTRFCLTLPVMAPKTLAP